MLGLVWFWLVGSDGGGNGFFRFELEGSRIVSGDDGEEAIYVIYSENVFLVKRFLGTENEELVE